MKIFHIGLFGTPSASRPFADNTKGASEAARLQAAPKFSAVSATGCPLIVEPWQVRIERTLPGPEDIMAFAADHLSHQLPAVAGLAHDLLDRRSASRQGQDSRICLFAANVPFILQALGRGEQFGIDCCRPDRAADLPHRFADGIKEGPTGILHQMPTICDLYRVRHRLCRGFAISSTTVTSYDRDRRMSSEPCLGSRGLTVRQQRDDSALFQIADDAGVSVIAPPGPIINADNPERVSRRRATASDHAKERILAHRQHKPFCEACRWSSAKRQTEVMDDRVQPRRASRRWSQYPFGKALSEDLAPAKDGVAAEAAGDHQELYNSPRKRQIGHASPVPAMDTSGNRSARWTQTDASGRPDRNNGLITFVICTLYNKPTRHETGAVECLLHGAEFSPNQSARHPPNCIKSESEPNLNAD